MDPRKKICIRADKKDADLSDSGSGAVAEDVCNDAADQQQYCGLIELIQSFDQCNNQTNDEQQHQQQQQQIWREIADLIERSPSIVTYQLPSTGQSALMVAASKERCAPIIQLLLQHGAVWNALDRQGKCAGNYAIDVGNQEAINILVEAAVRAEFLLGAAARWQKQQQQQLREEENQTARCEVHDTSTSLECIQPFKVRFPPSFLPVYIRAPSFSFL